MNAFQSGFGVDQIFDNVVNTARASGTTPSIDKIDIPTPSYSPSSPSPSPSPTPTPTPSPSPTPSPTPEPTKEETASGDGGSYDLSDDTHKDLNIEINATAVNNDADITLNNGDNTQEATVITNKGQNITVTVNQTLKSLTTGAGNEYIDLYSVTSNISKVDAGAGDDIIVISRYGATTIDGGSGFDTLELGDNQGSGDATFITSLKSVERIDLRYNSSLSLKAFNENIDSLGAADTLAVVGPGALKLTLDASGVTTIDLSKVMGEIPAPSIDLINITAKNITLSPNNIKENITLGSARGTDFKVTNLSTNNADDTKNDTITLTASDAVADNKNAVIKNKDEIFTTSTTVDSAGIKRGKLTFQDNRSQDVGATLEEAQLFLNIGTYGDDDTKFAGANKVVVFKAKDSKSYLIGAGATTSTTDDIVIELVGLNANTIAGSGVFTVTSL